MTLEALRARFATPHEARLLVHRGTFGDAVGAEAIARELRARAGSPARIVDAPAPAEHWGLPSAVVERDGEAFIFRRLDESGVDGALACLAGEQGGEPLASSGGLLARVGGTDGSLGDALATDAYAAAARALSMSPDELLDAVEACDLTGRGGAHFPVAMKWRFGRSPEALLVVNAEEGEPGVFKDRVMLEGDPHRLIEGLIIAHHVVGGAGRAIVYINGQAHAARASLERAIAEASEAGILGGDALGIRVDLAIELRSGAGGYVCGEETVILNSIEGQRPVPRFKPPQITEAGLFGAPTVLNNVETLCAVTLIFDQPYVATKLLSLSGAIARPGVHEVAPDGTTTWRDVLATAGAEPAEARALLLGGPSGSFVPPSQFDEPLEMRALGAAGIVVLGAKADLGAVVRDLAAYNAQESCGECTPCREGTQRLVELLDERALDRGRTEALIEVMTEASLCQLGGMAGRPVLSALQHFPDAIRAGA